MNHDTHPQNPNQLNPHNTYGLGAHAVAAANQYTAPVMSEEKARELILERIIGDTEPGSVTIETNKLSGVITPNEQGHIERTIESRSSAIPEGRPTATPVIGPKFIGERQRASYIASLPRVKYTGEKGRYGHADVEVVRFREAPLETNDPNVVEVRYLFAPTTRPYTDKDGHQTALGVAFHTSRDTAKLIEESVLRTPAIIEEIIKAQAESIGISPGLWNRARMAPSAPQGNDTGHGKIGVFKVGSVADRTTTTIDRTKNDSLVSLAQPLEAEKQAQIQQSTELPDIDPRSFIEEELRGKNITDPFDKLGTLSEIMRDRAELGEDPHPVHHTMAREYVEDFLDQDSEWAKLGNNTDDKIAFLDERIQDIIELRQDMESNGEDGDLWMPYTMQTGYSLLRDKIAQTQEGNFHTSGTS
ncbi:MAG: hypothetical protein WBP26_05365 [Candidatus Saccharimonadales bacterium]